jgi:HD superfamily phosphohydrolase
LQALQNVAESLAAQYLDSYTAQLGAGTARRLRNKEINDALWGTVSLSPIEVAVLDSPLLQRLRFLRQMGAAHWVYPGAVHTRFEHAVGTLYQTQQLIDALNAQASDNARVATSAEVRPDLINGEDSQLMRLSSLFSHTGHLAFSDSAIAELEARSAFSTATKDFAKETSPKELGADPSFTQLLAHFIVKSPAVRNFLLTLVKAGALQFNGKSDEPAVDHAIDFVSRAVIGRRLDESRPQLQELVSGPFDASTLDALVRDAKFAGIPSVLDIRRLIQKLAVQRIHAGELPTWIGGSLLEIGSRETVHIFGIPYNATSILNELQLAQVLVTTKIRRHPKVLAAEQMLRSVIRTLADFSSSADLLIFLYTRAEDVLIAHRRDELATALGHNPSAPSPQGLGEKLELAANTLTDVRERRIWARALQLSPAAFESTSGESNDMAVLHGELSHIQRGPNLIDELCEEVARIRSDTGQPPLSETTLAAQISLRSLQPMSAEARIGRAIVLPSGKAPYKLSDLWGVEDNWVSQYLRGQPTTYLFCSAELADTVYVAFERLVDRRFGAKLPSGTIEASKRTKEAILGLKSSAKTQDFWHGHSWSIRPKAQIWDSPTIDRRIANVALKLSKVNTIQTEDGSLDRREATYRWLQQFETDRNIEYALKMLELLQVVDREKTSAAFHKFFADHPEFKGAYAVAFGDPKDGGVIQGYFAADQAEIVKVVTLSQWEREVDDRPLVFVDDCCGSGSQVCDVLAAWFGRKDLREPLGEARDTLSEAVRQKLLHTKVAFLFITGWDAGLAKVRDICAKLGMEATVSSHIPETDIPFLESELKAGGQNAAEVDAFIARCEAIGGEILQSNDVDAGKLETRRLGYGNRGMLLTTLVNVPTQTVTLLWDSGMVDGARWEALLPRRSKK